MKKISLDEFFEKIQSLNGNKPNEMYNLVRIRNKGIGVQKDGRNIAILKEYSIFDFDRLYEDIIEKIKESNWNYSKTLMYATTDIIGEYSGYSACIGIYSKAVFLNIQNAEIAKRIQ